MLSLGASVLGACSQGNRPARVPARPRPNRQRGWKRQLCRNRARRSTSTNALEITAADVASASIEKDGDRAFLKLVFTKEGNTKLEKLTKEHRDKPLAVLLDGKVLVAPVISSTLTEQAVLSGIEQADLDKIVKGISGK